MIKMNEKIGDYHIGCIDEDELDLINKWYNLQMVLQGCHNEVIKKDEFYDSFLASYLSEGEFFYKIKYKKKVVGLIKGRIEKKEVVEMWITNVVADKVLIDTDQAKKILLELMSFMLNKYNVEKFYAGIFEEGRYNSSLWEMTGFSKYRVLNNYFSKNNVINNGEILCKLS